MTHFKIDEIQERFLKKNIIEIIEKYLHPHLDKYSIYVIISASSKLTKNL